MSLIPIVSSRIAGEGLEKEIRGRTARIGDQRDGSGTA